MQFRDIKVFNGPSAVSAACPFCKFYRVIYKRTTVKRGMYLNQAARKPIWDHIKVLHTSEVSS